MKHNKYSYFLNAIHYCLWRREIASLNRASKTIDIILYPIKLFLRKVLHIRHATPEHEKEAFDKLWNDKRTGINVGSAHHWFGYFYSAYSAGVAFLVLGLLLKCGLSPHPVLTISTLVFFIAILYIPAYKAVLKKDIYIEYFKNFEKQDKRWRARWARITFLFCLVGLITGLLGMWISFLIGYP